MFELTHKLPEKCLVAVSGGVDSVAALHWLSRKPGRVQGIVHVNHGTKFSERSEAAACALGKLYGLPVQVHRFDAQWFGNPGDSLESVWRDMRYESFETVHKLTGLSIVLAHNFNDCLEEYLICTMVRGYFGTMPYAHGPCIRPFRKWKRSDIVDYAARNSLEWVEDPSNKDEKFLRTRIRHQVVPLVKNVNPGIWNLVEKAMDTQDQFSGCNED